jgi:energy-converting hydrogenase Eha subunit C
MKNFRLFTAGITLACSIGIILQREPLNITQNIFVSLLTIESILFTIKKRANRND